MTAPAVETPWRVTVPHGEATIRLDGPFSASGTSLRGAIPAALFGSDHKGKLEHVDWHQHVAGGETRKTVPPIMYRVDSRGTPRVFAWGRYAHEHLTFLARELRSLRLPNEEVRGVEAVELRIEQTDVGLHKEAWFEYELRTPYFPSRVVWARRPRRRGEARKAWAGQALASSIRMWLAEVGIEPGAHRPVHVHLTRYQDRDVAWRGGGSGDARDVRYGFEARFVTNAILPDGLGLGQHRSEGFGEVRRA